MGLAGERGWLVLPPIGLGGAIRGEASQGEGPQATAGGCWLAAPPSLEVGETKQGWGQLKGGAMGGWPDVPLSPSPIVPVCWPQWVSCHRDGSLWCSSHWLYIYIYIVHNLHFYFISLLNFTSHFILFKLIGNLAVLCPKLLVYLCSTELNL